LPFLLVISNDNSQLSLQDNVRQKKRQKATIWNCRNAGSAVGVLVLDGGALLVRQD
jgi:hypothetical protein